MSILRIGRATCLLPVLAVATLQLLPAAARDRPKSSEVNEPESPEAARMVYRIIANEWQTRSKLAEFSPRVETYLQHVRPGAELGDKVTEDAYFLGRLKFAETTDNRPEESSFLSTSPADGMLWPLAVIGVYVPMEQFAVQALVVDENNFDRQHYAFRPVRWEYLGDLRCLAIDVSPRDRKSKGAFEGRIWVEEHDNAIVRLNGTRINPRRGEIYVHFDCWRENLQPGLWLPVYIYSQESDRGKGLRFKAETRLWGYDLTTRQKRQEWTNIQVEAPAPVRDHGEVVSDMSPLESRRQLTAEAEQNVLDRLEKARLIAPPGPVDKVLETVVNNLRATNHLENLPPVRCRVMLTSNLESFSLAYTIVLSRGLLDVLPDEGSLAMILAHELAHIALGHKLDDMYAFHDRLQSSDEELLARLDLVRDRKDETAADTLGLQLLKNSPYKDNLGEAGLFLQAAAAAAPHSPQLFGSHLGNGLTEGKSGMMRMTELMGGAPKFALGSVDQIAALPLGSRVQVNAWDGSVAFTTRKAAPPADAREKMLFRVTPVIPYLRMYKPKSEGAAKR